MHNMTRNRGLAFVEMDSAEEAAAALAKLEAFVSSYFLSFHPFNNSICYYFIPVEMMAMYTMPILLIFQITD